MIFKVTGIIKEKGQTVGRMDSWTDGHFSFKQTDYK